MKSTNITYYKRLLSLFECRVCGLPVVDREIHDSWHESMLVSQSRSADAREQAEFVARARKFLADPELARRFTKMLDGGREENND